MSWFQNDSSPVEESKSSRVFRYRIAVGAPAQEITFLDAENIDITINGESLTVPGPIRLNEYRVTVPKGLQLDPGTQRAFDLCLERLGFYQGGWSNFSTQPTEGVDVLRDHERAAPMVMMTVIDHSEYRAKNGKTYKDDIKLFAMKRNSPAWGIIQRQLQRRGSLRGCKFLVERHGDKSPAVGNSFEFIEQHSDIDSLPQPLDYGKVLEPKSQDDLKRLLQIIHGEAVQPEDLPNNGWGWGSSGGDSGSSSGGGSEDIPF